MALPPARRPRRSPPTIGFWLGGALLALLLAGWARLSISRFEGTAAAAEEVFAHHGAARTDIERLWASEEAGAVEGRSFLLTGFDPLLLERSAARRRFLEVAARLRGRLDDEGRRLLVGLSASEAELDATFERAVVMRRTSPRQDSVGAAFVASQHEQRQKLEAGFGALRLHEDRLLAEAREAARLQAARAVLELAQVAGCALLLAVALAFFLARAFLSLQKHQAQLALANEDLEAFAGRVAHDLRSVLAGLPILAATARRPGADVEATAGRLDRITKRAKGVIDGLLAFSRAGQAPDAKASASAAEIAADAIDDLLPLAQAQGITVEADLEEAHARCEPALLHVALMNLLSNAIKFSTGKAAGRIVVRTRRAPGRCLVEVDDTGPGIAPEALPHIFEPFYRAPGAKGEGAGLGLATVRRIVEAHGGGVEVHSALNRGTIARLWFPFVDAAELAKPTDAAEPLPTQDRSRAAAV